MRKMLREFRDFINKGDVVTIAVGLVLALYFQKIVDAVVEGLITPIIAAIFGEANFTDIGFTINGAEFSVGRVINAIITFVAVAFVLFLVVRAYNRMQARARAEQGPAAPAAPSPELAVLTEIRDELRAQRQT